MATGSKADIIINVIKLQYYEKKLKSLNQELANRTLSLHFSGSKGEVVDRLNDTAQQLLDIGASLASMTKATESALTNARLGFIEMDDMLAAVFQSEG